MRKILSLLLFCCGVLEIYAQNEHLTGHYVTLSNPGTRVIEINPVSATHVWGLASVFSGDTSAAVQQSDLELLTTIDGGITWQTRDIPGTAKDDSFVVANMWPVNETTCYISFYNFKSSSGGKIIKTINGGVNWQPVVVGNNAFANGFLDFIYFFSVDSGVAVGDPNGGYFEIYTTANGGQNWARVDSSLIPAPLTMEAGFINKFSFSGNSIYFRSSQSRMFYSNDRGYTWQAGSCTFPVTSDVEFQVNSAGKMVAPDPNQLKYAYSNNLGASYSAIFYPNSSGKSFFHPIKTKSDDAFISGAYSNVNGGIIDSMSLFICSSDPSVNTNWNPFTVDAIFYGFWPINKNYFYSENLGWLAGYWAENDTAFFTYRTQAIYRYENCAADNVTFNLPDSICDNGAPLTLSDYASPAGGSFYLNLGNEPITELDPSLYPLTDRAVYFQYVYENNNNCVGESIDSIHIHECATGISSDIPPARAAIYPNPTEDVLMIQFEPESQFNITITDNTGKKILEEQNLRQVDLSNFPAGIYAVIITTDTETYVERILKQKN